MLRKGVRRADMQQKLKVLYAEIISAYIYFRRQYQQMECVFLYICIKILFNYPQYQPFNKKRAVANHVCDFATAQLFVMVFYDGRGVCQSPENRLQS